MTSVSVKMLLVIKLPLVIDAYPNSLYRAGKFRHARDRTATSFLAYFLASLAWFGLFEAFLTFYIPVNFVLAGKL